MRRSEEVLAPGGGYLVGFGLSGRSILVLRAVSQPPAQHPSAVLRLPSPATTTFGRAWAGVVSRALES
jgi:hypothetical protein